MAVVRGTSCGFVTEAPVADPLGSPQLMDTRTNAFKDISPATATKVTKILVWVSNATEAATLEFGIYTHNAGDDNPEELLGMVTIAKGTTGGWKSQNCDIAISPNTIYWIAAQLDDTATATNIDRTTDAGAKMDLKVAQTELENPWGVSDDTLGRRVAICAVWEAAPVGNAGIMTPNTGYWGPTF